jgi:hypothetical protein
VIATAAATTFGPVMTSDSFRFGMDPVHEVRIDFSRWGRESYFVDGVLVDQCWSMRWNGERTFEAHGHSITVRVRTSMKSLEVQAHVDGRLVADNLFAEVNAMLQRRAQKPRQPWNWDDWISQVVLWFAIAFGMFSAMRYFKW